MVKKFRRFFFRAKFKISVLAELVEILNQKFWPIFGDFYFRQKIVQGDVVIFRIFGSRRQTGVEF